MVEPVMDGPDYTTKTIVSVSNVQARINTHDGKVTVSLLLDLNDLRSLFGQTGDALKLIEANADPS